MGRLLRSVVYEDRVRDQGLRTHQRHQVLLSSVVKEVALIELQCLYVFVVHAVQNCSVKSVIPLKVSLCESELAVINGEYHTTLGSLVV